MRNRWLVALVALAGCQAADVHFLQSSGDDAGGMPGNTDGGAHTDGGAPPDVNNGPPPITAAVSPPAGSPLRPGETITLRFSQSIQMTGLQLGGQMASQAASFALTQTTVPHDTLVVTPTSAWTAGLTRTLSVTGLAEADGRSVQAYLRYDIGSSTYYYVNTLAANDSGSGQTPAAAKKTIQAAINAATAPAMVLIAEGNYPVLSGSTSVQLKNGVSIYGGYAADFSSRDSRAHTTTITDTSTTGGTFSNPNRAIAAGTDITSPTVVDGVTVVGGDGDFTGAVFVSGGSPTFRNDMILGGRATTDAHGAVINGTAAGPVFEDDVLQGGRTTGSGNTFSTGAYVSTCGTGTVFFNDVLVGGSAPLDSMGMFVACSPTIRHNLIAGGGGGFYSTGIEADVFGTAMVIENNLITTAPTSPGGYRVCIAEGQSGGPASVRNNALFDCPTALYANMASPPAGNCPFNSGSICLTSIADVNDPTKTTGDASKPSSGNTAAAPAFADFAGPDGDPLKLADDDWHFARNGSSPCAVTRGGVDLSSQVAVDRDGRPRPGSDGVTSIGPYESDGPCAP